MKKNGKKTGAFYFVIMGAISAAIFLGYRAKKRKGIFHKLMEEVAVQYPEKKDAIEKKAAALLKIYEKWGKGKPKKVTMHTVKRIYPCIAVYQAMVEMTQDQEKSYQLIENYFAKNAAVMAAKIQKICKIPLLYRLIPFIMGKMIHSTFGVESGFAMIDRENNSKVCHIDMTQCPYYNCCKSCGCTELTTAFCNSDDVSYGNMHPKVSWERTTTLGRGDQCCNFIIRLK